MLALNFCVNDFKSPSSCNKTLRLGSITKWICGLGVLDAAVGTPTAAAFTAAVFTAAAVEVASTAAAPVGAAAPAAPSAALCWCPAKLIARS